MHTVYTKLVVPSSKHKFSERYLHDKTRAIDKYKKILFRIQIGQIKQILDNLNLE